MTVFQLNLLACLTLFVSTVQAQEGHFVVLPNSETAKLIKSGELNGKSVGGYWLPMKADVDALELKLPEISKLHSAGGLRGMQIAQPANDYRQYVAIMINGKKTIYVNAFCMHPSQTWATRLQVICDGGTCVWRVLYDVETQTFSHLTTNGRA